VLGAVGLRFAGLVLSLACIVGLLVLGLLVTVPTTGIQASLLAGEPSVVLGLASLGLHRVTLPLSRSVRHAGMLRERVHA